MSREFSSPSSPSLPNTSPKAVACISQGIRIKGELNGTEDLFVDGQVDGKISLGNSVVTVGPNAVVKAEISAREVVVRGRVEGRITGTEKIQIWSTARINGDMKAQRIAIEEGAELHGKLEAGNPKSGGEEASVNGAAKKTEVTKIKDAVSGEGKPSSGAAVAGAD